MLDEQNQDYRSIWLELMQTPFTQGWLDAGGVKTRYVQAGPKDKPAVMMLHGTAGSWETFCRNLSALSQHFNCVAIDMIGTGFSGKPDHAYEIDDYVRHVRAVLNRLGIKKASFIGVSLGAWIAARFALLHPNETDRLILVAPAGLVTSAETMSNIRSRRTKAVDDPSWENISEIVRRLVFDRHSAIPDIVAVRQATYRLPDMKRAMQHILVLQEPDVRKRNSISEGEWAKINHPTLVIRAVDVQDVYSDAAGRLKNIMPNVKVVDLKKVNHWAHFESADEFNKLAIGFLG